MHKWLKILFVFMVSIFYCGHGVRLWSAKLGLVVPSQRISKSYDPDAQSSGLFPDLGKKDQEQKEIIPGGALVVPKEERLVEKLFGVLYMFRQRTMGISDVIKLAMVARKLKVRENCLDLVDQLVSIDETNEAGMTPFYCAATYRCFEALRVFDDAYADIHKGDNLGWTALHLAACLGHDDVVGFILGSRGFESENGRILIMKNQDGDTALQIAVKNGYKNIADMIEKKYREMCMQKKKRKSPRKVCSDADLNSLLFSFDSDEERGMRHRS